MITNISSEWVSGSLVFYETAVGQSATGDVLTLGIAAVKIGGTSQDVDFQFYATGSKSFIIDAGAGTLTLTGITFALSGETITNATLGVTAGRAIKVSTSQANAAMEDGYGVVEIDHTITGTAASNFSGCGLSSWVNIPSGTVGAGKYVCAQNNGIYEDSAATITNARIIFGLRAQKILGDVDALSFPFSINTSNTAITAFVDVNNTTDLGWTTGVGSAGGGKVPFCRDNGGTILYVNTYTS